MGKVASQQVEGEEVGLGRPLPLRLSLIVPMEGQPRRTFDEKELLLLADDIQQNGQETAVKVFRAPTKPPSFVLIGGERRWRAFHIIKVRTGIDPLVDAIIDARPATYHEHFERALRDNLRREDLVPLDEAAAYDTLKRGGKSTADIATLVGKSYNYVDSYIKMNSLPQEVKDLMDLTLPKEERLSVTAAIDIARSVPDTKLRISLAKESIERGLGVQETRSLIQLRTGKSGFGIGGRLRKPSDDYKVVSGFIGRVMRDGERMNEIDLQALYASREDEKEVRARDARRLGVAIGQLEKMLKAIENTHRK